MISVEEARQRVLERVAPHRTQLVTASRALDHVLAESIASDIDSPPHDKSLVDGYAIRTSTAAEDPLELQVVEEVTAGEVPRVVVSEGSATRIMTGAPIPDGANAVVMVEDTELVDGPHRVLVQNSKIRAGQHIMPQGASLRRGEVVLQQGHVLRAVEMGLLAEVGATSVRIYPSPSAAILSTGNELVPANQVPGAGQIRNSNGDMLDALVRKAGGQPVNLGICRDDRDALIRSVEAGLQHDLFILSGGVSAGVLDLVPAVLAELEVEQVFHKVHLRPGKPLWFGVLKERSQARLVFGLPGNPVSGFVCFELFVRPALRRFAGHEVGPAVSRTALLATHFQHRGNRPTYCPAVRQSTDSNQVAPLPWKGSADLRALVDADCLAHFPAGERDYEPGDEIEVVPI